MTGGPERAGAQRSLSVDVGGVHHLSVLLGAGPLPAEAARPLPPLWHWAVVAQWPIAPLGADGHPVRASWLPSSIEFPRRMFAGGRLHVSGQLRTGERIKVRSGLLGSERKQGRSGEFVLATLATDIDDSAGRLLVHEEQDLVFRTEPSDPPAKGAPKPPPTADSPSDFGPGRALLTPQAGDGWRFAPDAVDLMRFSAITANTHRIHYDWPYATGREGYPDLVVHGPLIALALAESVRRTEHVGPTTELDYRIRNPMFCGQRARIDVRIDDRFGETGALVATATMTEESAGTVIADMRVRAAPG